VSLVLHDAATFARGAPYDEFRRLRDDDPVSRHAHPVLGHYWSVARHVDVLRVSRDSDTFSNAPHPMPEMAGGDDGGLSELLISKDPPEHTKLRKLINRGFTPRRVADLTARLEARVAAIIESLRDCRACDLVEDVAIWLPLHVIADLVGVPEEDRRQVFAWTEITFGFDPAVTAAQRGEAAMAMYAYADAMCEERAGAPRDDLLSVLLHAEVDGERLTQLQIDLFFLMLQNAGSETTRNLITTGTLALLEQPAELARLRADLSQLPVAIEELLRYVTPVMCFLRRATCDTVIGDQPIAAGDRVMMLYASANRDERAFDQPDRLDVTRSPNEHVAFGAGGPHYCLGASLARLEARVMFESILTRFEGLAIDGDPRDFPRVHSNLIDGYARAPVTWSAIR
jgi:cytochrome P450